MTTFESLGLAPALLRALSEHNYTTPTPIQAQAIPLVLARRDVLGGAQTGTGKTAAFGLPLLQRLAPAGGETAQHRGRQPRALVLAPTRELALQVAESLRVYGRYLNLEIAVIFGGAGMGPQVDKLRRGIDILVATPGRLIDHLDQRTARLDSIEMLVLDEADRMLDMGFLPAMKRILAKLPAKRQTLLFSATFETRIKALALEFMREPEQVQVAANNTIAETITHRAHPVDAVRKRELLIEILAKRHTEQVLVFGRTKHGCNRLAEQLERAGLHAVAIHGNKSQGQREKALAQFKSGKARVLVATDVAARGLDIPNLPLVINHDLPMVAEDYVHRIGRTGRAGAQGEALSLVSPEEGSLLRDIQRLLKMEIHMDTVEGFEPSKPIRLDSAPFPRGGRGSGRSNGGGNGGGRSAGEQAPRANARKSHRPHGKPAKPQAQAHAGPKQPRGRGGRSGTGRAGGGRSGARSG